MKRPFIVAYAIAKPSLETEDVGIHPVPFVMADCLVVGRDDDALWDVVLSDNGAR